MADDRLRELERKLKAAPTEELAAEYERHLVRAGQHEEAIARRVAALTCEGGWNHLEADSRGPRVRRCARCQTDVHWVEDVAEARRYAAADLRVSGLPEVLRGLAEDGLDRLREGRPEGPRPACFVSRDVDSAPGALEYRPCTCLSDGAPVRFHTQVQDTDCAAWQKLLALIEEAAGDGRQEFAPLRSMTASEGRRIVTLPSTIRKLTSVRKLTLYGSCLVQIPPEIGAMRRLREFTPYTSYRLHWFPYEIIRCRALEDSTVSTRAIYGNYKYRPSFPDLALERGPTSGACSVCEKSCEDPTQVWISLLVATDVLPLLVNACSQACVDRLPETPQGYVQGPHRGGPSLEQPGRDSFYA